MSKPITRETVRVTTIQLFMRTGEDATLSDIAADLGVTEAEVLTTMPAGRHHPDLQVRMDAGRGAMVYGPTREALRQALLSL